MAAKRNQNPSPNQAASPTTQPSPDSEAPVSGITLALSILPSLLGASIVVNEWQRRSFAAGAVRLPNVQIDGADRWSVSTIPEGDLPGIYLTHIRYQHQWEIGFSDRQNKSRDLGSVIQAMKPYMDNHGKCLAAIGDAEFCLANPESTPADIHRAKREIDEANEKIASIETQSAELVARRVQLEGILEEADRLMAMKSERRWWFSFDLSEGAEIFVPLTEAEEE